MNAQEMWNLFAKKETITSGYEAWAFGGAPDKLAQLTLDGIKTATASAYPLYEREGEELPKEGEFSVILDSGENAVCVIQTSKVYVVPFAEVSETHAYKEGEGDRSLDYWRQVHEEFFIACMQEAGLTFTPQMKVVCEEFLRVYP